jgi:hypothetical protein
MRSTVWIALLVTGCIGAVPDPPPPAYEQPDAAVAPLPPDGPPPPSALMLLQQWSGCMTLANFQTAQMAQAWGTLLTSNGKQCQNCHGSGEYGFIATSNETLFFETVSKHSGYLAKYFSADVANSKVKINTASFELADGAVDHPRFNVASNQGMTALTTFYGATVNRAACDAPTLVD